MIIKNLVNVSLSIFIATIILFALPSNVIIANIAGIVFFGFFFVYKLISRSYYIYFSPIFIVYLVFTAYSILSIFWSTETNISLEQTLLMLKLLVIIFIVSNVIKELKNAHYVTYGIFFALFINYILYFNIFSVSYDVWLWTRYMGTTGNPNVLAIISIYSIFLSIYLIVSSIVVKKHYLILININIILSFFMIIVSASKKGMIFGLLLILLYLMYFSSNYKRLLKLSIYIILSCLIFIFFVDLELIIQQITPALNRLTTFIDVINGNATDVSSTDRLKFTTEGFLLASDNPFFGHGIATFRYYFGLYAHNNYIEIFFGLGIIGIAVFYSIYLYLLKKSILINNKYIKRFIFFH